MRVITFSAKVKNGKLLVPDEYLDAIGNGTRVVILLDAVESEKKIKRGPLKAAKIKTKGLSFDRDEANRR
jgi:hypothetical protein